MADLTLKAASETMELSSLSCVFLRLAADGINYSDFAIACNRPDSAYLGRKLRLDIIKGLSRKPSKMANGQPRLEICCDSSGSQRPYFIDFGRIVILMELSTVIYLFRWQYFANSSQ